MKIPITKPEISPSDIQAVTETLRSGWLVQGPQVADFENKFKSFVGCAAALATTSCTTALHLALKAAQVGPGDEVILPAFTWIASANVVENLGARPVFADIDLATYNIDVEQTGALIGPNTKAIMPVSLFGLSADLDPLIQLAGRHSLVVVEDAACALGSFYRGHHAGTLGDYGCFSFHPRKVLTTGEGGMLTTNSSGSLDLLKSLRDHGASLSDLSRHLGPRPYLLPEFHHAGYNYRMTDLQAALGSSQMDRIRSILEQRRHWAEAYQAALVEFSAWLRSPYVPAERIHSYQSFVCLYAPEEPTTHNVARLHQERNALMDELHRKGISTRPGTHCLHTLDYYKNKYHLRPESFPRAYLADQLSITLPLYGEMTQAELDYVIGGMRAWRSERS